MSLDSLRHFYSTIQQFGALSKYCVKCLHYSKTVKSCDKNHNELFTTVSFVQCNHMQC